MNILRLCPEFYSEKNLKIGLSGHLRNLSNALKKEGVNQTILTEHSDLTEFKGMKIIKYKSKRPFSQLRSGLFAFKKIKELNEEFDLIHFHNPFAALISMKRKELPPIIMTLHGSPIELKENIELLNFRSIKEGFYFYYMAKFAAKRVNLVVTGNNEISNSLIKKWYLPIEKVKTITTAVDSNLFKPLKKSGKEIDLIFVGRLAPKKRPLMFLEIVKKIRKFNPRIKAVMIGGSENDIMFSKVKEFIKKNMLQKNVMVVKPVKQEKLVEFLNNSRILVLPSVSESSPKAVLEAMACSIPVVSTNILGNKNLIIQDKTGFILEKNDLNGMIKKIKLLIEDESFQKRLGENSRRLVLKNFSWKSKAREYKELYESII